MSVVFSQRPLRVLKISFRRVYLNALAYGLNQSLHGLRTPHRCVFHFREARSVQQTVVVIALNFHQGLNIMSQILFLF